MSWDHPATTTTLSSPVETFPGQTTTFIATVAPTTPTAGDPAATGTVTFLDGASALATVPLTASNTTASARFSPTGLAPGLHVISAAYNGDAVYDGSTSTTRTDQIDALPAITSPASASAVVGARFSFTVRSAGYPAAVIIGTGSNDGLTLTNNHDGTATLAGAPTAAGTNSITLTADNGLGTVAVQQFTLTVTRNPLTISTTSLPAAFVGQAYTAQLIATGGTPPVTWSVSAGALPAGLQLAGATGTISGTPTSAASSTFTIKVADATSPTRLVATRTLTLAPSGITPAVYTANGANDSVTSYPLTGGNHAPATRLAGTGQGLNGPAGLVINAAGRLYVADSGSNSITEYDRGATGPTVTISGPDTGLASPGGLALDGSGRLYVADRAANTITVYSAGAAGDATPLATITGPDTGLSSPAAVTVDPTGRLWVANAASNSLTAYPGGATGDARPAVTIAGSATGLNDPQGLTQDATGNLLVTNTFGESVTVYPANAAGNAFPAHTISGSATRLSFPTGIDVDTAGTIYVANQFDNDITEYPAAGNGNTPPTALIAGSNTALAGPAALAVTPARSR